MAEEARPEAGQTQAPAEATAGTPADDSTSTPVYEVGFHLVPQLGDEGVSAAVEKIRKALGDNEIISEGFPQRMTLAYTIERATEGKRTKFSEAYFGWIKFALNPEQVSELQEKLRGMKDVLRYLVIETVREDIKVPLVRAVFSSDRLEGQTLKKPVAQSEKGGAVDEVELEKSIEALVSPEAEKQV